MRTRRCVVTLVIVFVFTPCLRLTPARAQHDHDGDEKRTRIAADGTIELNLPKSAWRVSAVLVGTRTSFDSAMLIGTVNAGDDAALAADPAVEMKAFKPDLPGLGELPAAVRPQPDYGANVVVGNKGWPLRMVLHAAHYAGAGTGSIRYSVFEKLIGNHRAVRWAVPVALGDTFNGAPVVATIPNIFGVGETGEPLREGRAFQYRSGKSFEFADGRPFHATKFEAVVGSETAERHGVKLGDRVRLRHGDKGKEHDETWEVVGVLKPTDTANDQALFIPLVSFYAVPDHENALRQREMMTRPPLAPQR